MQSWWMTSKSALIAGQIRERGVSTGCLTNESLETRLDRSRSVGQSGMEAMIFPGVVQARGLCHGSLRGNESKPIIIVNCLILASGSEYRVIPSRKQVATGIRGYLPNRRKEGTFHTQSGKM